MEGLDQLPSLTQLWLFSNKIMSIEGLENCVKLRELWLQDNMISSLGEGLFEANPHLEILQLAGY